MGNRPRERNFLGSGKLEVAWGTDSGNVRRTALSLNAAFFFFSIFRGKNAGIEVWIEAGRERGQAFAFRENRRRLKSSKRRSGRVNSARDA